jgi:GntR family transcriptional repressor for pyruvate dehydrogenase complex
MEYESSQSGTLANRLASRIHEDIIAAGLSEGEFFMTGDQVEAHYAVSRSIAREALSQLRSLGILESRQKKGLLVSRPDPVQLMARWVPFYGRDGKEGELERLAQLRYVLEVGAVDLAVGHASEAQLARLQDHAVAFEAIAARSGHSPETDQIDLAFHRLILEMTGNPLVAGMHKVLSDYFLASAHVAPLPREDAAMAIREHHLIVEAFRRHDRALALSLLRAHLQRTLSD